MTRYSTIGLLVFVLTLACLPQARALELSRQEADWLAEHRIIRVSGPQAFPPFRFPDKDGTFIGMAPDYMALLAKTLGITLQTSPRQPWPEVLQGVRDREIDVLDCVARNDERSAYLGYTDNYLIFPLVIVTRKETTTIRGLGDLADQPVAFVSKNITYDRVLEQNITTLPYFVTSPLDALIAVSMGQANACIENLAAASYLIEKNGLTNLKIAAPTPIEDYALAIGVRKDWPELIAIFNKALASIPAEAHSEIRQNLLPVRYEYGIDVLDILKWVAVVSAFAITLLSFVIVWNRRLAREIEERKKAEAEKERLIQTLTTAIDEIKTLRGILPICSNCKKIRDDKGYWTRIETYIANHSEADFSHSICPDCMQNLYGQEEWFDKSD